MHSVSEVFTSYCQVNVDLAETTLAHSDRALRLLLAYLTEIGHSQCAADVSKDEVDGWRAWMIRSGTYKPSTINSYLRGVAPIFRWCTQRKNPVIRENPFSKVKYLEEDIPVFEYTQEEVTALLDCADIRWKGMVILACSAGLARGEILNLVWDDFDCDGNRVTVRNKKNDASAGTWEWSMKRRGKEKKSVILPMSSKVVSVLMELRSMLNINQPYPFIWSPRYWDLRSQIGSLSRRVRNCPDSNFDTTFRALCIQAGIQRGERDFHDLRKTAITNWTRIPGLAPQDVQALARHSSLKTTMRYMAVNPAAAAIAQQHSIV